MEEAQSTYTYEYIRRTYKREVHVIGIAKWDKQEGECKDAKYPEYVKIIRSPV